MKVKLMYYMNLYVLCSNLSVLNWRDFRAAYCGHIKVWVGQRSKSASTGDSTDVCGIPVCKWIGNWRAFQVFFQYFDIKL